MILGVDHVAALEQQIVLRLRHGERHKEKESGKFHDENILQGREEIAERGRGGLINDCCLWPRLPVARTASFAKLIQAYCPPGGVAQLVRATVS